MTSPRRTVSARFGDSFLRYLLVGLTSFAIDIGALHLGYQYLHLPLWLATVTGFWLSFIANFAANRYWTFAGSPRPGRQLTRYSALVAVNSLGTVFIVIGLHELGLNYVAGKVLAVGGLTVSTFILYRRWVFLGPAHTVLPASGMTPSGTDFSPHHVQAP